MWLTIAADGTITIVSPAAEMGQGTMTALPAIIADELDADWAKVRTVLPPAWEEKKWGNPGYRGGFQTSASNSVQSYFKPLRIAGAQARRVLLDAAASRWNVPVGELSTEPSVVVHRPSGRRLTYGEIAAFAKAPATLPPISDKDLKSPANFRYIGRDVARVDVPSKVTGAAKYAIDVQVPGMVYGGGAAIALSRRRAAIGERSRDSQAARNHRRRAPAGRRRRRRHDRWRRRGRPRAQLKVTLVESAWFRPRQRAPVGAVRRHRARSQPRRRALRAQGRCQGRHEGRGARLPRRLSHPLRLSRPDGAAERDGCGQP